MKITSTCPTIRTSATGAVAKPVNQHADPHAASSPTIPELRQFTAIARNVALNLIRNPLTTALGGVLILNVLLSFRPGISFGGHIGGAVAGVICGLVTMAPAQRRVPEIWTYITPVVVGLASIGVAVFTTR